MIQNRTLKPVQQTDCNSHMIMFTAQMEDKCPSDWSQMNWQFIANFSESNDQVAVNY